MATISTYLAQLKQDTNKTEAEIMAQAVETGLRQLWREQLLGKYLRGEMTREQVLQFVDIDWVELADQQRAAMLEDVAWGFQS